MNDTEPVARYYDRLADSYDNAANETTWKPPGYVAEEVARSHGHYDSVLIVGIGTGKDVEALKYINPSHIEAIDISSNMLTHAAAKFPDIHMHHGDFLIFDGLLREKYDLIICSGTVEFMSNFLEFFKKCSRLLGTAGQLIMTYEPVILHHKFQQEACSETVSESSGRWGISGFITYRRGLTEFLENIRATNFRLEAFSECVAYKKSDADIIYHFARLVKE
jgi:ubiquinone/menaquinone biosynthesis C-methylase UbiE